MDKCTQGELNKKDIENIKILSQGQTDDIKEIFRIIRNIELQNATMIEKLDESMRNHSLQKIEAKEKLDESIRNHSLQKIEAKEEVEGVKKDLKEHLAQSEGRIKDIEKNSTFRKVGCYFLGGVSLLAIGSAIDRFIRG